MIGGLRRALLLSTLMLALPALPALAEQITVTLKLKNSITMQQLAKNVRDPNSAHYGRAYEPAEIRQLAAPSDADYDELLSGLKAEGMEVLHESPTHLWVTMRGERAIYQSLFSANIQSLNNGRHALISTMSVPVQLSLIESVSGLDSTRKSSPRFRRRKGDGGEGSTVGGIPPATIKTAYGFDSLYASGLTGQGVDIAIATYDGFKIDDVTQYYALSNISPAPNVDQVNVNGTAVYNEDSAGETELDAEFSGMIAPGASIHIFTSATNDDAGELALFTSILDDNRAKIVNYSWGGCETGVTPQHQSDMDAVFARAVAQGVNIFVASGDSGSDSCGDGTTVADWPAANPNVVAVGGTTLNVDNGTAQETGWSDGGGGISGLFDLPAWQQSLGAPYIKRSYPDVSFNADPDSGEPIYASQDGQSTWIVIGGTSMAAPQWSGFMALVSEARAKQGSADLGFLNPIIYGMSDQNRAKTFHDVTEGSNGAYSCGPGWDAVTGFGSMQADALAAYLKSI